MSSWNDLWRTARSIIDVGTGTVLGVSTSQFRGGGKTLKAPATEEKKAREGQSPLPGISKNMVPIAAIAGGLLLLTTLSRGRR